MNREMIKTAEFIIVLIVLCSGFLLLSYADSLVKEGDRYVCYLDNGDKFTGTGWKEIYREEDGYTSWHYFYKGRMQTGFTAISEGYNKKYYFFWEEGYCDGSFQSHPTGTLAHGNPYVSIYNAAQDRLKYAAGEDGQLIRGQECEIDGSTYKFSSIGTPTLKRKQPSETAPAETSDQGRFSGSTDSKWRTDGVISGTYPSNNLSESEFDRQTYIYQGAGTVYCPLASAAMMLRRKAYNDGNGNWASVTLEEAKKDLWAGGMRNGRTVYSRNGVRYIIQDDDVSIKNSEGNAANRRYSHISSMLASHPEGVVAIFYDVVNGGMARSHAVLITKIQNGTIYCLDPAQNNSASIPIADSYTYRNYGLYTQDQILNLSGYGDGRMYLWYIDG